MCSIRRPHAVRKTIDCLFVFSYGVREHAEWWMRHRHLELLLVDCCWCFSSLPLIGELVSSCSHPHTQTHTCKLYISLLEAERWRRCRGGWQGADVEGVNCRNVHTSRTSCSCQVLFLLSCLLISIFGCDLPLIPVHADNVKETHKQSKQQQQHKVSHLFLYQTHEPAWITSVSLNPTSGK